MTTHKNKKRLVRARMAKTGEAYQSAERAVSLAGSPTGSAVQPDDDQARIGMVLAGRYRLEELVSGARTPLSGEPEGAPWAIYGARHALLGGDLDIKLLSRATSESHPHLRAWLLREGRALQRGAHPRVLKVFDIGETESGEVYLVLERSPRTTLGAHLESQRVDERFALEVLRQIAEVLDHLHRSGVIHRGIRNGVIHLEGPGAAVSVKLSSFSFADLAGDPRLTRTGAVFGHPAWMSPEQCRGEDVDGRSDLYSLGVVLFAMLAHRLPFWDEDRSKLLELQCAAPVPALRAGGSAPSALEEICLRLLAKNRDARYPHAGQLLEALRDVSPDRVRANGVQNGS
ncbi:MAG: serine/threonine-protein kinase [Polyangiaceae bacterium]